MTLAFRRLDSSDAAIFKAVRLAALRECPAAFSSSYEEECDIPLSEAAARMAPDPNRAIFGAFDGEHLVGTIGIARESKRKLAHKAVIWGVYVAPAFRGRGIGRELLDRALTHAASLPGLVQVTLGANAANAAAVALYKSVGFEPFGLERGFLLVDGALQDEVHMALTLATHKMPTS